LPVKPLLQAHFGPVGLVPQLAFVPQALWQKPQLFTSLTTSTQAALQTIWLPGQTQLPDWHDAPVAQTFPHVPQLLSSMTVQVFEQAISFAGQTQLPLEQEPPT
jgi:hypothetical protein